MSEDAPLAAFASNLARAVCDESFSPSGELGQNFLTDWGVAEREVSYADLEERDTVLEIGPGMGSLTCYIAREAGRTIAIEKDDRLAPILSGLAAALDGLEVVFADALEYDLGRLGFTKVVANLPYGAAVPILFDLLEHDFESGVVLVQADLADRVTTAPGDDGYNRLSVQFYRRANIHQLARVPRDAFYPAPAVDGAILKLTAIDPKFRVPSERVFRDTLMYLFAHRDQPIGAALEGLADTGVSPAPSDHDRIRAAVESVSDAPVDAVPSRDFGEVTRALSAAYGDDLLDAYERYFDAHNLYERARGPNEAESR